MTFLEYLKSRNIYRTCGFSAEEALLRKYLHITSRDSEIVEKTLDDFLEERLRLKIEKIEKRKKRRSWNDVNRICDKWIETHISVMKHNERNKNLSHKPRKNSFPNYLFQYDVLPLSKALERGLYDGNIVNVFKDPNHKVEYISKKEFIRMLKSRGEKLSDYF